MHNHKVKTREREREREGGERERGGKNRKAVKRDQKKDMSCGYKNQGIREDERLE